VPSLRTSILPARASPVADREDVKLYRLDSPEYDAIAKEVLARAEIATFTH
jgi:hypothetical protein